MNKEEAVEHFKKVKKCGLYVKPYEETFAAIDILLQQASLVDTLISGLKTDYKEYTEQVKHYEEMRRNTPSDFYRHSYQTTIHKLNAKREYIKSILKILEGN
jgi:dsDNA-specific endonuclease/ATPase MutS2